jgi:hypothetical protein
VGLGGEAAYGIADATSRLVVPAPVARGVDFSVTVQSDGAPGLVAELPQILREPLAEVTEGGIESLISADK